MISSESKTIIGDREAFAELYPKAALRAVDLWHLLAQQRYAPAIGEEPLPARLPPYHAAFALSCNRQQSSRGVDK